MPAIITHHLFGEDSATLLPQGMLDGSEDLLAFLLGNQGPDPLFVRCSTIPQRTRVCHAFARRMHTERMTEAFFALRESVSHLREDDKTVGRAFVLGVAAHYLLDSIAHPLVEAQASELASADPDLGAAKSEVCAIMEAEIDSWVLWQKRQQTVLDAPCDAFLACTGRIEHVAGALMSQVAWEVYGLEVGAVEYVGAIRDYRMLYRLIDPPASKTARALMRAECVVRGRSSLDAMAHPVITSDSCAAANLTHRLWKNPATGEASRASLPDLFHDALIAWPMFAQRLVEGDRERLAAMIGNINYYGAPVA